MIRVQPPEDLNPTTKQHPRTLLEAFPNSEPEAIERHQDTVYEYTEAGVMILAVVAFFALIVLAPKWWPL